MQPNQIASTFEPVPGMRGTTSGFEAVLVRQYSGAMWEIRVPGGLICTDIGDFIPSARRYVEGFN